MPSDEDFRRLSQQVGELASSVAAAKRRIAELEDFATDHIGLDWGATNVDINSPHPNISANTIETGGGVMLQTAGGIQFRANEDPGEGPPSKRFVAFVPELMADATEADSAGYIYGFADASGSQVLMSADNGGTSAFIRASITSDAAGESYVLIANTGPDDADHIFGTYALLWVERGLALSNHFSVSQITSSKDDYAPTYVGYEHSATTVLRLDSDASRDITGIAHKYDGQVLFLVNVGSNNIVLKDESASSTAANRFALNGDITLAPDNSAMLWYDGTSNRWRCMARYT